MADVRSRFSCEETENEYVFDEVNDSSIKLIQEERADFLGLTAESIKVAKAQDTVQHQVKSFVETNWPSKTHASLQAYSRRYTELATEHGIVMWNTKIIIPKTHQQDALRALHAGPFEMFHNSAIQSL
ncbi:hypothetical protein ACOME3_007064 [Neoechinorhynchus agilis]